MDPRARIEAFLADYAAAHAEVKPLFDNKEKGTSLAAFDAWRLIHSIRQKCCDLRR